MAMALISSNPTLEAGFARVDSQTPGWAAGSQLPDITQATPPTMTLSGSIAKTALALVVLVCAAVLGWGSNLATGALLGLFVVTFVLGLLVSFSPMRARYLTLPYAVLQGLLVGSISRWYADGEVIYGASGTGLVWSALGLTVAVFAALLFVYATRLIKPSENFKLAVASACTGVFLFYMATFVLRLFGIAMPLVHSTSAFGIGFSLLMVVLASACLVTDFDFVERAVAGGKPKQMEWYAAFGLMVSVVWLYIEILRLLAKLQSRSRN